VKVVAAMSGGVDSAVAAALLVEQGHEVIGVHMKLHDQSPTAVPGTCCGLDDAMDARRVADALGIPFYVSNLRDAFKRAVMDQLADTYLAGHTPNPCIRCNGVLKFRVLLSRARALGASHLATGHYARIVRGPTGAELYQATDAQKDQSYFLFPILPDALNRTLFPLGGMHKEEVRAHAERLGLAVAQKAESQEICFIPDDDHARFVKTHRPAADGSGDIVHEDGRVLGTHDGFFRFTVGQRRGLGVAYRTPLFVLRVEPATGRVVVTDDPKHLAHSGLWASGANWFDRPGPDEVVHVRIRHRGRRVPCRVNADRLIFRVDFLQSERAVAPGQAAVFYRGDKVLGGAWIARAIRPGDGE
jgi:tRNA-specific 2-thiouridylase